MIGNAQPRKPRAQIGWEVRAVADRLRHLSEARLAAPLPPHESRAEAGRQVAQRLSDAAAGIAERGSPARPVIRIVPAVGLFAVGEQVAVTGNDLIAALADVSDDETVWHEGGRTTAAEVITEMIKMLRDLRLTL